jgi:phosphopantetheinyl transferase (holo-ACP synthase)
MFWPVYYALIFLVLYLVIHTLPRKLLILYAALVFSVQILDASVGWAHIKKSLRASEEIESTSPLKSPFWSLAANNYKHLKTFPLEASQMQKNWGVFSNYCALNHMGTDIVYLARIDHQKIKLSNSIFLENISKNKFPSTEFYIIHSNYIANLVDLIGISHFRIIDGFYVFSPQGFFNIEIPPVDLQNIFPKITHRRRINFSSDSPESAKFLARGWSHQESWGVWSDGKEADILLPPNILAYNQIQITYRIYNPNQELKRVYVSMNAGAPQELLIKSDGLQKLYLKIPKVTSSNQLVKVHFDIPDAISPANLRGAADNRNLGIGLVSIIFN